MIIAGDLSPTNRTWKCFEQADLFNLFDERIVELFNSADFSFVNLECPLTDKVAPIRKAGPNLIAPSAVVNGIKALRPSLVGLANNHVMDHGAEGLISTVGLLDGVKLPHTGAGSNLAQAAKPYIAQIGNLSVGIYCCAEHEFSIATDDGWGANPFDPLESLDHITALKKECDYVVVIYHGGKELYQYPSPDLQKRCRKMVEKGADVVICQHSHCIGCMEEWNDGTIVYGQGNFHFCSGNTNELWLNALLVQIEFRDKPVLSFIPIIGHDHSVTLSDEENASKQLDGFYSRSEEIKDPLIVKKRFDEIALAQAEEYIFSISDKSCHGFFRRAFNKFLPGYKEWNFRRKYKTRELIGIKNRIECEPHLEILRNSINLKLYGKDGR